MRVGPDPSLPVYSGQDQYLRNLSFRLNQFFRALSNQLNGLTEGSVSVVTNAYTAAPTTGTYAVGDFVLNSTPAELGSAGSKYIIHGWRCTVSGTPGTWKECRFLTGA